MTSTRRISLVDLGAQYLAIRGQIDAAIAETIDRSAFIGGDALERFERGFAEYCGVESAVGVASGTDALELILEGLGIGAGDEVIVPSMTFAATAGAVLRVGATPVIVDVDRGTLNIDVKHARAAITPRTRALLAVHLYGQPADLDALGELTESLQLLLIEDAAQAHGARWRSRRVGGFGCAAAFSFYPGKNLGAYGDGGAVVTNDDGLAHHVRLVANHGRTDKYLHEVPGRNSRLDGLQAAILEVKLQHLDAWNASRRRIAALYDERLADRVERVKQDPRAESVHHLYVVEVPDRERVREQLAVQGVASGVHYPIPLHRQPAFERYAIGGREVWNADLVSDRILSLPMFPELADADAHHVADALLESLGA